VPVAVILLSVGLMYLSAYNGAVQKTLGLLVRGMPGEEGRSRAQVAIIVGMQLTRINATFLLGIAVYLIVARASAWYHGVVVVVLCGIGGVLIRSILNLHSGSPKILAAVASDLERRHRTYQSVGDSIRLHAVDSLLARLRSFPEYRYTLR
jgi:hypothetical protein